jgi:two-component system, OmpR family, response regulator NblR
MHGLDLIDSAGESRGEYVKLPILLTGDVMGPEGTPTVLILESDLDLAEKMTADLVAVGYAVQRIASDQDPLAAVTTLRPAMIVLDRLGGGRPGARLCRQLRDAGVTMPILLLTARDSLEDRVACLEAGADDYLLKPYRAEDLVSRVQLYLKLEPPNQEQLQFSGLILDLETRQANRNGRKIDLTMKEFELLRYLMEHPREVLTREQILENVWGYEFIGESNVIEVYVRYLRLKIEAEGEKRLIQTVRGVGYVLREG